MKHKLVLSLFSILLFFAGKSQIGGEHTYQFLELTNSARVAALGGNQVALLDSTDLNITYHNPALLSPQMDNKVLVNYVNYLTDINYGYASYAKSVQGIGNFALGMHYINYGKFLEATELGELTGSTFKAAEYALNIIYSNQFKSLKYGATIKPVLSAFESYQSVGIAGDLGLSLISKNKYTQVGLAVRNIGSQLTTYYDEGTRERIPLNVSAGISTRLQHAPAILSLTLQHLNNWDMYIPGSEEEENQNGIHNFEREEGFLKQAMRHAVFGIELLPSENFIVRVGYNYQRRQELKFNERASTVGFSAGFGVKIKRFRLDYGISRFHLAGSSNLFSLTLNLNDGF